MAGLGGLEEPTERARTDCQRRSCLAQCGVGKEALNVTEQLPVPVAQE